MQNNANQEELLVDNSSIAGSLVTQIPVFTQDLSLDEIAEYAITSSKSGSSVVGTQQTTAAGSEGS